ncbi:MAG: hypothetical protein K6G53_04010 [Bacteroidales bacterium]|nr:hypothetical protein [Bacteroidales bacterium]
MNGPANARYVMINEELLDEWQHYMFPDDIDEHVEYGEPWELPEEVSIGIDARDEGLTPMFSVADARVTAQALNRYLVNPLEPWEVLRIINLDLWNYTPSIVISYRRQRYVIAILAALMERLDKAQKRSFKRAMIHLFSIDAVTFKTEAAKIRNAFFNGNRKGVVNASVLAAYASFCKALDESRMAPKRKGCL